MDNEILNPVIQRFIEANIGVDVKKLAFAKNPFPDIDWKAILNQIVSKTKSKDKLPTWFGAKNIIYPEKISIEQTSSEMTAQYKAQLVWGNDLIDLTGGFGVDDYYFAKIVTSVWHCEINAELSRIVAHNFAELGIANVKCMAGDSSEILKESNKKWDWIYVDPSRRNDSKGKVFMLKDCLPNVPGNLDFYFSYANNILIKTAPLLDITAGISELAGVKSIHIVALNNEVKELVWVLEKGFSGKIKVNAVDLGKAASAFEFTLGEEFEVKLSHPKKFLYEPNAAIMKSGGFDAVSFQLNVEKLHQHSHLYTSDDKIEFPGRVFEILETLPYNKQSMKNLYGQKANVTTRNFPETVESIRKKWKLTDGGQQFCFFTTNLNNDKIVLLCAKT